MKSQKEIDKMVDGFIVLLAVISVILLVATQIA